MIELLIQVRVLGGTAAHDPLPLTRRFLRRWVPMGERHVRAAMEDLEGHEFVMRAGTYPVKGIRPMNLWVVRLLNPPGPVRYTARGSRGNPWLIARPPWSSWVARAHS